MASSTTRRHQPLTPLPCDGHPTLPCPARGFFGRCPSPPPTPPPPIPARPQESPDFRQAEFLKGLVEDCIVKEGLVGVGIGAAVIGVALAVIFGGSRK